MTDQFSDAQNRAKGKMHSGSNIPSDEGSHDLKRKLMDALKNPDSSIEGDANAALNWLTNTVSKATSGLQKNPFLFEGKSSDTQNASKAFDIDAFWPQKEDTPAYRQDLDFDDTLASKEEAWDRRNDSADSSLTQSLMQSHLLAPQPLPAKDDFQHREQPPLTSNNDTAQSVGSVMIDKASSGGRMADLSAYKDLSKAPMSFGDDDLSLPSSTASTSDSGYGGFTPVQHNMTPTQHFVQEVSAQEVDTEFSGNVKTLIRLVNELPEGVTKQTGAQIIRLTMEAMGISMENVLSEAQSAQSEMLDAVRANIKKIEEYKTVIRKLETDIKYYQGKANELSEIIDLFILSNTSGQKVPFPDDLSH